MPAFGWVGPAGMPADIVEKLTDELKAVGKIPEVRTALENSACSRPTVRSRLAEA